MIGVTIPPSGGAGTVLTQWVFDPLTVLGILAAGSLYAGGLIRLRRAGRRVDRGAAVAFFAGLAALVLALMSPVDAYADVSFTVHMGQHLLLTLLAPPLLALGAPVTLALRATPPPTARRISRLMHGRVASFLALPVVGWLLFIGVPYAIHFSPLFDAALRSRPIHALEHTLWITAALIYWWPIVGRDPTPHPMRYSTRLLSMFLAMPAMSFLAVAIYLADAPLYPVYATLPSPWGGAAALASQQDAAVLMWLVGSLGMVIAMLIVAAAWRRDDEARQRRIEAREDALLSGT